MSKIFLIILICLPLLAFAQRKSGGAYGHYGAHAHRLPVAQVDTRNPHRADLTSPYYGPHRGGYVVHPYRHRGFWTFMGALFGISSVQQNTTIIIEQPATQTVVAQDPQYVYEETPAQVEEPHRDVIVTEVQPIPQDNRIEYADMWKVSFWFECNSSNSSSYKNKTNEINLINVVDFLKKHPDAKINIDSYASKHCGTWNRNRQLAKERAQYIYNRLRGMGISGDRIDAYCHSVPEEEYEQNPEYNQCSVISCH